MSESPPEDVSLRKKGDSIYRFLRFKPDRAGFILVLSMFSAVFEGVGLSFLYPVITLAGSGAEGTEGGRILELFVAAYEFAGFPFTLESLIVGVALVMLVRYTSSFVVSWQRAALSLSYQRYLQESLFNNALNANISFFDREGTEQILNTVVTEAKFASKVGNKTFRLVQQGFITIVYLAIAVYIAPLLAVLSAVLLGGIVYGLRRLLKGAYDMGGDIATTNQQIQDIVQAGMQGIRDVKLFSLTTELERDFTDAISRNIRTQINLNRNTAAMSNFNDLAIAVNLFVIIYVAIEIFSLSLASVGVFLFAMFRLSPRISTLNNQLYSLDGQLPHLIRTHEYLDDIEDEREPVAGERDVPEAVEEIVYEDVSFSYPTSEQALDGISFGVSRGETVAFVGSSGAGKSTIVSLLAQMYRPTSGRILVNGRPLSSFDTDEWRNRIAVIRQDPYIFNDTLRYNLTIGSPEATEAEIEHVCEIARVSEFLDDLDDGYDTVVGEQGVRLSGGQRQRIAIARALLKDADVLILDEATSELDTTLERKVHQAIEDASRDRTLFVIAHRLSTVVNADRIFTLEDGRIVEAGDHSELLAKDGTYATLYSMQVNQ